MKSIAAALVAAFLFSGAATAVGAPPPDVEIFNGDVLGSGTHIGAGRILTAAHVIKDENSKIVVLDQNGITYRAKISWIDRTVDAAVLTIEDPSMQVAEVSCEEPSVGANIEVVGNPLGIKFIHSWGHVASSKIRYSERGPRFFADVTIYGGNSGGAVYSLENGERKLIGLVSEQVVVEHRIKVGKKTEVIQESLPLMLAVPTSAICEHLK
jgi:S1-C subfamily serine protease